MDQHFPNLMYSAGLVGHGSDVTGLDSSSSIDHDWGPHLHLFFPERNFEKNKRAVNRMLRKHLPYSYKGYSTNFVETGGYLKHIPKLKKRGPVNHLFLFWTVPSFFKHYLGFDIRKKPTYKDWLTFPQQALLEVTGGKVYHDELGLEKMRSSFDYFPDDVWKYLMTAQWGRIADIHQLPARTGYRADEVGSMIATAKAVQHVVFLAYLLERHYMPYAKWLGIMFRRRLPIASKMYPLLEKILHERSWRTRQRLLARAYQVLGEMHNKLKITRPLSTRIIPFPGRGYPIIKVELFIKALENSVKNKRLKMKNFKYPLGSVDQFLDHARINQINYVYRELRDIIK